MVLLRRRACPVGQVIATSSSLRAIPSAPAWFRDANIAPPETDRRPVPMTLVSSPRSDKHATAAGAPAGRYHGARTSADRRGESETMAARKALRTVSDDEPDYGLRGRILVRETSVGKYAKGA